MRVVLGCVCGSDLWHFRGGTVAVVGDGAVGLCAVLAARRLGAERVISLSRHPGRQKTDDRDLLTVAAVTGQPVRLVTGAN